MDNHWLAEWCNYWAYARWVHARLFRQRNQSFSVAGLLTICFILINLLHKRSFPKIETANVLESRRWLSLYLENQNSSLGDFFRPCLCFIWWCNRSTPYFCRRYFKVGPEGLGYLRAAPSIGALITMIALTRFPPTQHAWRNMLLAVAGFGVFTILFAFSNNMWLSLFALAMTGACDSISVVVRQTILQIFPPENMRGRVAAVNGMFVSSSNELGAFESGLAAKYLGTIAATILVVV